MIALASTGCSTLGPEYVKPDPTLPEQWQQHPNINRGDSHDPAQWLQDDPVLQTLTQRLYHHNYNLQTAALNFAQSRIQRGVAALADDPVVILLAV
jgi:hypothetical protein